MSGAVALAALQHSAGNVDEEVASLQSLLRCIDTELHAAGVDLGRELQDQLGILNRRLEEIASKMVAQKADLEELGKRVQALQTESQFFRAVHARSLLMLLRGPLFREAAI